MKPRLYQGKWWWGGWNRHGLKPNAWVIGEFVWMVFNGKWSACWQWPELLFGIGRDWYDGPIYYIHGGFFTVELHL